jgi:hypothetical protein
LSEWVGSDLVVLRRGEWWAAVLSDALLTQIMALRSSRRVRINWRKVGERVAAAHTYGQMQG